MINFYIIVALINVDYPFEAKQECVQAMGCYAVLVLFIHICYILMFSAPLVHRILGSYFSVAIVFYRYHIYVQTATDEQKLNMMSAAA